MPTMSCSVGNVLLVMFCTNLQLLLAAACGNKCQASATCSMLTCSGVCPSIDTITPVTTYITCSSQYKILLSNSCFVCVVCFSME